MFSLFETRPNHEERLLFFHAQNLHTWKAPKPVIDTKTNIMYNSEKWKKRNFIMIVWQRAFEGNNLILLSLLVQGAKGEHA